MSVSRLTMLFRFQIEGEPSAEEWNFPTVAAAKCAALKYASEVVCDETQKFWDSGSFQLTVSDEKGLALFALMISGIESPSIRMHQTVSI